MPSREARLLRQIYLRCSIRRRGYKLQSFEPNVAELLQLIELFFLYGDEVVVSPEYESALLSKV